MPLQVGSVNVTKSIPKLGKFLGESSIGEKKNNQIKAVASWIRKEMQLITIFSVVRKQAVLKVNGRNFSIPSSKESQLNTAVLDQVCAFDGKESKFFFCT